MLTGESLGRCTEREGEGAEPRGIGKVEGGRRRHESICGPFLPFLRFGSALSTYESNRAESHLLGTLDFASALVPNLSVVRLSISLELPKLVSARRADLPRSLPSFSSSPPLGRFLQARRNSVATLNDLRALAVSVLTLRIEELGTGNRLVRGTMELSLRRQRPR